MDRRKPTIQNRSDKPPGKGTQRQNTESLRRIPGQNQQNPKSKRRNLLQRKKRTVKLHHPTQAHSQCIRKPETPKNHSKNLQTLEGNHGIPQNTRRLSRQKNPRPQKTTLNRDLHKLGTSRVRGTKRRIPRQNRHHFGRGLQTLGRRLRIRYRHGRVQTL